MEDNNVKLPDINDRGSSQGNLRRKSSSKFFDGGAYGKSAF